jgi:L-threonylcarbamoyladenylate synthase
VVPADASGIDEAVAVLDTGGIVALPTETVYGLAADAADAAAVAAIYEAKGRPGFNPLIVHAADIAMARRHARFDAVAAHLAEQFWPGPLTLVLPLAGDHGLAPAVTAGLPTVALRVPAHPVMHAVIAGLGRSIAAPSANRSGLLSPTRASHVLESLDGRVPVVLNGGPTPAGLESTIIAVDAAGLTLLRPGPIAAGEVARVAGIAVREAAEGGIVQAPGMLLRHYAPRLPLRMDRVEGGIGCFHIGFGAVAGDANLSPGGDLDEAAARLFELLHVAEASGRHWIAVAPIPDEGVGRAIRDRLRRAASGSTEA